MTTIQDDQLFANADRVKGKVVIITGAANGIGRQTALLFGKHGAKVVIGDLDVAGAGKTVDEIVQGGGEAISRPCNVLVWEDQVALFEAAFNKYGAVDVVVPNAGVVELGKFDTLTIENGVPVKPNLKTLEVNLIGVTYTANLALHYLRKNHTEGSLKALIFLGSMASWQAISGGPMYSASKHAVLGLMRSLYQACRLDGIRVGTIHPWFADTAILPAGVKVFLAGLPWTPLERIAGAIMYAATDPDFETSGCAWLLPDDGPVFLVQRENFREGVYGVIDARTKRIFKAASTVKHYGAVLRDLHRIFGNTPILFVVGVIAASWAWRSGLFAKV